MADEWLRPDQPAGSLQSLVARAVGMDAAASARLRSRDGHVEVFVTTPLGPVAMRRIRGGISRDGAVVGARNLLDALVAHNSPEPTPRTLSLGRPRDPSWPGALPPAEGFRLVDEVPVVVATDLAEKGRVLARQFSGPLGPPASLLEQTVLTVSADSPDAGSPRPVEIPMRVIFTATSLGLLPGLGAPPEIPRHLRVSGKGRWLRLDAPYGTVFHAAGGPSLLF